MKSIAQCVNRAATARNGKELPRLAAANLDKWRILRNLTEARETFGLGSSEITTLQGLLSLLEPGRGLMIYAGNRVLTERAHGINERTLRRHIARLIAAGLIIRNDSTNGKRYKLANSTGDELAYGFDLTPLFAQAEAIEEAATVARQTKQDLRFLRARIRAAIARLQAIAADPELIREGLNLVRRKLSLEALKAAANAYEAVLGTKPATQAEASGATIELSVTDGQSVRHNSELNNNYIESDYAENEDVLLRATLANCTEALSYAREEIADWRSLTNLAWEISSYCGISPNLMKAAENKLGSICASVAVLALLQRSMAKPIRSIPAYFRSITSGKHADEFNPSRLLAYAS